MRTRILIGQLITTLGLSVLGSVVAAPAALAENPHFVRASASGPNSQGTLTVNFERRNHR